MGSIFTVSLFCIRFTFIVYLKIERKKKLTSIFQRFRNFQKQNVEKKSDK